MSRRYSDGHIRGHEADPSLYGATSLEDWIDFADHNSSMVRSAYFMAKGLGLKGKGARIFMAGWLGLDVVSIIFITARLGLPALVYLATFFNIL